MRRCTQVLGLALVGGIGCAGGPGVVAMSATAGTTGSSTSTEGASSTSVGTSSSSGGMTTTAAESESGTTTLNCTRDLGEAPRECDVWAQDCCPGEKCNAWAEDEGSAVLGARCVPVESDPDAVGEPCTAVGYSKSGVDSCEMGSMCWYVDSETLQGYCVALCQGDLATCTEDPYACCSGELGCSINSIGVIILCEETCHPLTSGCSLPGFVCYPVGSTFECAPDASGEMGAVGDPCESINTCDPGTFCGNPATLPGCDPLAAGCCIPFCLLGSPECPPGTECEPWYDPMNVPPGYEDLGACVIPP